MYDINKNGFVHDTITIRWELFWKCCRWWLMEIEFLYHHHHHCLYNSWRALAPFTILLHFYVPQLAPIVVLPVCSDHWSLRLSNVFLAFLLPTVKKAVLRSLSSCDLMTCPAQLKWLTLMWRTEFTNPAALYSFSFSIIPLFVLYTALKLCSGSFENDRIHFFRQKFSWYIISRRVIWIGYKDHVI